MIVDGTTVVIRAWFANAPEPWRVGLRALRRSMRGPSHVAVVVDRSINTFRRQIAASYKAHREPAPPGLVTEFRRFEAGARELSVPVFGNRQVEADDCSATLTRLAVAAGLPVRILANDKDLFQLVRDEPLVVMEDHRGRRYDRAAVRSKLGVEPEQVADYLSLVGDASDGVAGVPGIGARTAVALLGALGSLENILADPQAAAGVAVRGARTLPGKIIAGREAALLARRLVVLKDDVDLGDDPLGQCLRQS